MNKSELNRKIQILEKAIEELETINYKLMHIQCSECNKVREVKNKSSRRKYVELMSLLGSFERRNR